MIGALIRAPYIGRAFSPSLVLTLRGPLRGLYPAGLYPMGKAHGAPRATDKWPLTGAEGPCGITVMGLCPIT